MFHLPILRQGEPYQSLTVVQVPHYQTGEPLVEISQANAGLIRRDLQQQTAARERLAAFSTVELLEICKSAAEHFAHNILPLGEGVQTPLDYVKQVSATTGLPHVLVRRNMEKIRNVLAQMGTILNGLTRNLAYSILDAGYGEINGQAVSFYPRGHSLGVILPSNSPGVHSLWIPAIALKTPLVLKPGSAEPWSPYRIIQALIQAGCPREVFGFYPADHAGAGEILRHCGRSMLFGDAATTKAWRGDPRVELHGPGYSKVIIGEDCIDDWEQYLDVMVASIVENGGRSCINASGVWVPAHAAEIAEALAARLAQIEPRAAEDEQAQIAPFANPDVAAWISDSIDQGLSEAGATDVTAAQRAGRRLVTWQGSTYLLPTIVRCEGPEHPLANREFLFPYASVVPIKQADLPAVLGASLVVTAITQDEKLIRRLLSSANVDRLNIGPLPTNQISWDQPHEGNLFEHLYARRAFQQAAAG